MQFRVMDETVNLGGRGLALLVNEGDESALRDGCRIRDVRGNEHVVARVSTQDGLTVLLLENGDEAYFGRLFRDIFVDATLFTLVETDA